MIPLAFTQTNTLPPSGNVGIGTLNPAAKLQVNGKAQIDSSLYVKDSMTIERDAHVKGVLKVENSVVFQSDLKVKDNLNVKGISRFKDDIVLQQGNLKLKSIADSTQLGDGILLINGNGKVTNGAPAWSFIYNQGWANHVACTIGSDTSLLKPVWENDIAQMYLPKTECVSNPRLGIGVKPQAKLQILNSDQATLPLLFEKQINATTNQKLLQLDNTGLLMAREVKVKTQNWPDFVFEQDYHLQPLSEVEKFIQTNKHLPDVPSANEIEADGVRLGEMNKILLQKVEELTLHLIEQQKILKRQQQMLLDQQQELNRIKVQSQN